MDNVHMDSKSSTPATLHFLSLTLCSCLAGEAGWQSLRSNLILGAVGGVKIGNGPRRPFYTYWVI